MEFIQNEGGEREVWDLDNQGLLRRRVEEVSHPLLSEVKGFPINIQISHMARQTKGIIVSSVHHVSDAHHSH